MTGPIRILVTGSRNWTDRDVVYRAMQAGVAAVCPPGAGPTSHPFSAMTLVHGAARGLDTIAAEQAAAWGMRVEAHPAQWERYGKSAGHRRNAAMVALGASICLAFPLGASPGTRDCMTLARAAGIRVVDHGPAEERCDRTDLLVAQCGCARHRGKGTEPAVVETVGQAFVAQYPGQCAACDGWIEAGQNIARVADVPGAYVHAGGCPR